MKLFISALFLVSSATALSANHMSGHAFEYFHGRGHYETPGGHKGKFLASLMVKKHDSGKYSLRYSLHSRHHDMEFKISLGKPEASGVFAITHKGDQIGYGYCFDSVCHLNYSMDSVDVEDTFSIHKHHGHKHKRKHAEAKGDDNHQAHGKKGKRMFFSMGSKSHDGMIKKSWVMHLHKVY